MTNSYPLLIIVTTVSTNWVLVPGDIHREGGSNLSHQVQMVTTNVHAEQITLCTNRMATVMLGQSTNGIHRWVATPPPLPTKE